MQSLAISLLVIVMMAGIGLELTIADLRAGLRRRWALLLAVVANVVLMPALMFGLTRALALPSALAMGLLVCAVAPGGPTGPLFARMARADLGFATSLQVLLAWLGLFCAPAILGVLAEQHGEGSLFWPMFRTLLTFQLLPLVIGMFIRARFEAVAARLAKPFSVAANVLLLTIIIGLLLARGQLLLAQDPLVHGLLIVLVLAPLGLAWLFPNDRPLALAIGLVTTVRNLSVALLLSATFYRDPAIDAAILVWGFYMMVLPALISARLGKRQAQARTHARDGAHAEAPVA